MTDIEKIKKSLDIIFDYVNNQNTGVVQTKAINELEYVIKKVENLSICSVVDSSVTISKQEYYALKRDSENLQKVSFSM